MRHSSYLEVNLGLLSENMDKIQSLAPKAKILPMVKADAYGNGLVPISRFLSEELHYDTLGCASLGEAIEVFQECPKLKSEILVFSDNELQSPEIREAYINLKITPVLHQVSDVDIVLKEASFKNVPIVLKINTGMNRLGLSLEELEKLTPRLKGRGVDHLLTHFSCSYYVLKEGDKNHRQYEEFKKAQKILKDAGVEVRKTSIANSGAIEQGFGCEETYVRPGLMMYGPPSVEPRLWNGHQISRWVTKILKVFAVKKGTPVGYGINVAGEDLLVAIIPLGYGDGLLTYSSGVSITVNGIIGKLFARINMDMAFIAFDLSTQGKMRAGDVVEIWGHDNRRMADIAAQMKTIPYQLMTAVSHRIPRVYRVN